MQINGKTKLYAIIGNPVSHSLSPAMHNAAFQAMQINGAYVPVPSTNIHETIQGLRHLGFGGASITIPHKETVMSCVDILDPIAKRIGAVNTLLFERSSDEKIVCKGFNTDWLGSNKALAEQVDLKNSRALVLGAGGAAKAVAFGLIEAGASNVVIANRTHEKAVSLAQTLACKAASLADIDQISADILINTTSVGMTPHDDQMPIDTALLSQYSVVMDIVYDPLETKLLKEAKVHGCKTVDGLAMLQYQGLEQFRIWTGVEPTASVMRKALLKALHNK